MAFEHALIMRGGAEYGNLPPALRSNAQNSIAAVSAEAARHRHTGMLSVDYRCVFWSAKA
jgi:hypothetical protein